ncbi:MAG: ATP-binding protein [Christensenellaceae bacterium]|jgi:energy-coupling factor transporter ATP-binding protein EcfA2|nr:ATP-binding protein [Christensenellaceae bacterium]
MRLLKFRVTDFRAIVDSGWIDCGDVVVFAGDNESGKTTLFFALLKATTPERLDQLVKSRANIRNLSAIDYATDVPIDRADILMPHIEDVVFIRIKFSVNDDLNDALKEIYPSYQPKPSLIISKTYGGKYTVDILADFPSDKIEQAQSLVLSNMPQFLYYQEVTEVSSNIDFLTLADKLRASGDDTLLSSSESMFLRLLTCLDIWEANLVRTIAEASTKLKTDGSDDIDFRDVLEAVPLFHNRVKKGFEKLNEQFLECWGKNDTIISFEGYNRGISIKIIDQRTGKFYDLENRSTGFRRFFAHFLTFSITGLTSDMGQTLLMFDEAGAAMHSITQRKLSEYFLKVSTCSQVLYNTHSSYMIPVKYMNNVRVVYKDEMGHVCVSSDLTIDEARCNELALFPVQSSLGLYIAEKSLAGCLPIIVLNEEDETYLSLIKNILISKGKLNTIYQTLVFSTGLYGIDSICAMFSDGGDLPAVLLAGDEESTIIKERLLDGKYKKSPEKVLSISNYLKTATYMEDLLPINYVELSARLYLAEILPGFSFTPTQSIMKQIIDFAENANITLPKNFRYEIAKRVKLNVMSFFRDVHIPYKYTDCWSKLWKGLIHLSE